MDSVQTWLLLKQLREDDLLAPEGEYAWHEVGKPKNAAYPSVENQMQILNQLQNLGAIKIQRRGFPTKNPTFVIALQDSLSTRAKGVWFQKISPTFEDLCMEHSQYESKIANTTPMQYWITKENGKYFFDGRPVHFKSKRGVYIKIFNAVYSLIPQGGSVLYTDIQKQCGANKNAVLRALSGDEANFFLHVHDIERVPAHGVALFEPDGKGSRFVFNNAK